MSLRYLPIFLFLLMSLSCGSKSTDLNLSMANTQNPLPACPDSPNCVLTEREYEFEALVIYNAFREVLTDIASETPSTKNQELKIDAVFNIPVFGWKDDVVIQLATQKNKTIAYIRSASREGYSDLGVNKRRVKKILSKVDLKLQSK